MLRNTLKTFAIFHDNENSSSEEDIPSSATTHIAFLDEEHRNSQTNLQTDETYAAHNTILFFWRSMFHLLSLFADSDRTIPHNNPICK